MRISLENISMNPENQHAKETGDAYTIREHFNESRKLARGSYITERVKLSHSKKFREYIN